MKTTRTHKTETKMTVNELRRRISSAKRCETIERLTRKFDDENNCDGAIAVYDDGEMELEEIWEYAMCNIDTWYA